MLLELVVGFLFVVTYAVTVSQVSFFTNVFILLLLYRLLLLCGLFVLFFIDLRLSVIPSSVLVYLGVVGILGLLLFPAGVITTLLSAVGAFLFFLLIFLITKGRGMGFGDVLFAFVMGLILGFPSIVVAVYIAFLTGALVSLILVLRGRKKLKSAIPFGPFLVAGTVLCLLWGEQLSHIFLSLLRIV
jgi:prepilin signal peptidase PulO-like enzyme (type II secretory pathway)